MKILLDTHTWIWSQTFPDNLSTAAVEALSDGGNEVLLSAISVWETMMLTRKGRLNPTDRPERWVGRLLDNTPARIVPLSAASAIRSELLPGLGRWDPADRFIIATALEEDAVLLTADQVIRAYDGVQTLW